MSYTAFYDPFGRLTVVLTGIGWTTFVPPHDPTFLSWLSKEGKTLEQWLIENPAPKPKLADVQKDRLISIKKLCEDRLSQHYSVFDLLSLSTTLMEASATGLTNRAKYLYPLKAWSAGAYDFFYAKQTEVLACKSVEEVQAVKDPDFSSWEALKPDVKYEAAMAIKD